MTTTEPTTDESATTPPADTPAPVVQEPAAEPATDAAAATADTEQPEQEEQPDTEHTTEAEETDDEQDTDPRLAKVRAEAKGLRGRLRDAEGERDTAGLRLTGNTTPVCLRRCARTSSRSPHDFARFQHPPATR